MDAVAEKLDARLHQWRTEIAAVVREWVVEILKLADALDTLPMRVLEQEVLDMLDEPMTK